MGNVIEAVTREIQELPPMLRNSGKAATALVLAERLEESSSRDAAGIARELRQILNELQEQKNNAPKEDDPVNAIRNRRSNTDIS